MFYLLPEMEPLHTWLILSELTRIERKSQCAETARVQRYIWEAEIQKNCLFLETNSVQRELQTMLWRMLVEIHELCILNSLIEKNYVFTKIHKIIGIFIIYFTFLTMSFRKYQSPPSTSLYRFPCLLSPAWCSLFWAAFHRFLSPSLEDGVSSSDSSCSGSFTSTCIVPWEMSPGNDKVRWKENMPGWMGTIDIGRCRQRGRPKPKNIHLPQIHFSNQALVLFDHQ